MDIGTLTELTEPSDWNFKPLEELDQLLRCPICFEYYKTAMMFHQCSHNFCSLCIRRYLSTGNSKCPMCSAAVTDGDLKNNRLLDHLSDHFTKNRRALLGLVQSAERGGEREGEKGREREGERGREREGERGREEYSNPDTVNRGSRAAKETRDENLTCSMNRGKNRQFVVPEAPNLPDSEAFVGNIIFSNDNCTTTGHTPNVHQLQERVCGDGGGEGEGREVSDDTSSHSVSEESKSPSVLLPWRHADDVVWEEGRERTRLFGDLGRGEGGERSESGEGVGMCNGKTKGKGRTKRCSYSSSCVSTPSRTAQHSSTASPLPPSHSSPHPTSLNHTHNTSTSSVTAEDSPSAKKVECPVCGLLVPPQFINRHLDNVCLKQSQTTTDKASRPRYSKFPKLVYQLMKDKQLKLKLKEYHLPTHGDRGALISRLKEFILRFNSQCDSLTPRPPKEVAMEIEREERLRETHKQPESPVVRAKREINGEELERQHREYEETHKEQFSKLISKARGGGESERECAIERETSADSDTSEGDQQDRLVLAGASPEQTPPLKRGRGRAAVIIPESPCSAPADTRRHQQQQQQQQPQRMKRRRLLSPPTGSPPSPPPPTSGHDPEFVPPTAHYRTPLSTHTTRASKRQRRHAYNYINEYDMKATQNNTHF